MNTITSNARRASNKDDEVWLQDVAVQIAESGPAGVRFLLSSVADASGARLRAILLGLSAVKKPSTRLRKEICEVGKQFLRDRRPLLVAESIDLLSRLGCIEEEKTLMPLLRHPSPYVVGSVLRFLARHCPETAIPLLTQALTAKHAVVRQNAVDELDELNCVQALPAIKRLLRDSNRHVQQAARTAVMNLQDPNQTIPQENGKRRS